MTTRIELTYDDTDLVVTGEYIRPETQRFDPVIGVGSPGYPSEFQISRIEQDGRDVTAHYRALRLIRTLEDMACEVVEAN